ncbi:unnamed protein product, partial [Rotaria sp. Silwood1]
AIPNSRTAVASLSSPTSSSQPVLTPTNSKNKQTVWAKKRGHSSEDEESDDDTPVLHISSASVTVKPVKAANVDVRNKHMQR